MTLKGFLSGTRKVLDNNTFVVVSMVSAMAGTGYIGDSILFEEWDGQKTEKTEMIAQDFRDNIKDLELLRAEVGVLQGKKDQSERKEGSWSKDSKKWEQYTLSNIRLSSQYNDGKSQFIHDVITNTDLPERTISNLVDGFNTAHLNTVDVKFPKSDKLYALREAQEEVGVNNYHAIVETLDDKTTLDEILVTLFLIPGVIIGAILPFFLMAGIGNVEERIETRQRKKINKPNN